MRILKLYEEWMANLSPIRSMWPKPTWSGLCVAYAFAAGSQAGIGGVIYFPSGACRWLSLPLHSSDFDQLHIPAHTDLQTDIAALETLGQIALVNKAVRSFPGARIPIRVPTPSDNTGANKLFALALFLEKLCLIICSSRIEVEVQHIPGRDNEYADALSRWSNSGDPPHNFLFQDRIQLQLSDLWLFQSCPKLLPPDTWIPWKFPD